MSGREAVRSFREGGSFASKPPSPQWLKTALFAAALVIVAGAGFFAVPYLLPVHQKPVTVVVPGPVKTIVTSSFTSKQWLTKAETDSCDAAANKAVAAASSRLAHTHQPTGSSFARLAAQAYGYPALLDCLVKIRPARFCEESQRNSLQAYVGAQASELSTATTYIMMSDEDLLALKRKDPKLSPIALSSLKRDISDLQAGSQDAIFQTRQIIGSVLAAGYVPAAALRVDLPTEAKFFDLLLNGLPEGPNVCPS